MRDIKDGYHYKPHSIAKQQLDYFINQRGMSFHTAVNTALDRMYREEKSMSHFDEMHPGYTDEIAAQQVEVEFSESALFGDTDMTNVDAGASIDSYAALLRSTLREHYRDCDTEITVQCGIQDKHVVDGIEGSDEAIEIGEMISRVWQSRDWIVKK